MAKLIYAALMSLDGYVADANGKFDWAEPDEEVHSFVNDLARPIGTYLLGRRMYEVLVAWETMDTTDEPSPIEDYAQHLACGRQDRVFESRSTPSPVRRRGSNGASTPTRSAR